MKKFFGSAGLALLAISSLHAQNSGNGVGDRLSVGYASDTKSDKSDSTLTDPATGLMWARQDNGIDVNWRQSSSYCARPAPGGVLELAFADDRGNCSDV